MDVISAGASSAPAADAAAEQIHSALTSATKRDAMDDRFVNASGDDNLTSVFNLSTSSPEERPSSGVPLYTCALYKFLVSGVITLIISIIGLVGKSTDTLFIFIHQNGREEK